MSKYIEMDELISAIKTAPVWTGLDAIERIRTLPTIDIVRCGECVKANTKDCSHSYWDDDWGVWRIGYKGDDWFCADGERSSE